MPTLVFNGDILSGSLALNNAQFVCVPAKEHHNVVDLCLKSDTSSMNIGIATIDCNWLDYQEKRKLGYEIEKRWNLGNTKAVVNTKIDTVKEFITFCEKAINDNPNFNITDITERYFAQLTTAIPFETIEQWKQGIRDVFKEKAQGDQDYCNLQADAFEDMHKGCELDELPTPQECFESELDAAGDCI